MAVDAVAFGCEAETVGHVLDFAEQFGALAQGGSGDEGDGVGVVDGVEQECDGGHPAFAPLARAVEDNAFARAGEEFALFGLQFPTEGAFGEFGEIGCGLGAGSAAEFHGARSWKRGRTLRMFLHNITVTGCPEWLVEGCL